MGYREEERVEYSGKSKRRSMIIGITGNIGSGKSTFAKIFAATMDWKYIDMDVFAKVKCFEYRKDIEKICRGFGFNSSETNYLEFLKYNYFKTEGLKTRIDEFIKPKLVLETFQHTILESALLFEEGFDSICDLIVVVTVDTPTRFSRLEGLRGMRNSVIRSRLGMQIPDKDYIDKATFVVDNNGTEYDLLNRAEEIRNEIYTKYSEEYGNGH
jgi:dephospho-CoA kinase